MEVQVQRSFVLNQSQPDSKPYEIPLNVFDLFSSNIHVAVLYAFSPPTPSNSDLILGLSKTLLHFPTLTASLGHDHRHHRPCFVLGGGGGGTLVVEATVSSSLSDHLPLEPSPDFLLLHPSEEEPTHIFQVQINRFKCGGLVIGTTANHRVADGQSMSSFFVAWSQTVRGVPISSLPVYDQSWLKPRSQPRCEFQHWGVDFATVENAESGLNIFQKLKDEVVQSQITDVLLHFSWEFIAKLKSSLKHRYTTFEALLAHLWRKITIARELDRNENVMVRLTVNGRRRLKPPVPDEFFGNLVVNAYPKCSVEQLLESSLEETVGIIHEAIAGIDEQYIQSFIDFGAINEEVDLVPQYDTDGIILSPKIEVDSWLKFRFEEVDFGGGGKLRAFLPTWLPFEGLVIFIPSLKVGGGVDVLVTLLQDHARRLRHISHSID